MTDEEASSDDMGRVDATARELNRRADGKEHTVPRPYWVSLGALERGDRFRLMESDEVWFVLGFAGDEMTGKHYVDARRERDGRFKRFSSTASVIPRKERALCRSAVLVPKAELEVAQERVRELQRWCARREETAARMGKELMETRVALKDVRAAHSEMVAGWQRTSEDNERLKREIHTMNRELSGWGTDAQRGGTEAEINLLRGRLDEAIGQNEVLRGELREKESHFRRLQNSVRELKRQAIGKDAHEEPPWCEAIEYLEKRVLALEMKNGG